MAYYLKKTKIKGRTYLSIDESFYSQEKKGTAHRCYKSLASVETWQAKGIEDPIAYFQAEVDELNKSRKAEKEKDNEKKIDKSPMRHLGYFPFKNIMNTLNIEPFINLLQFSYGFRFSAYEALDALVYSRLVNPCSKLQTYEDVLPRLFNKCDISYDQILTACEFLGNEYQKVVEIFSCATSEKFGIDTSSTYFDCTNFYFEIDKESDFQKKGPSKENRSCPLVGMGLLLDANQIPIGLKLFPGNESEKPKLREIITELKTRNNIKGRTIQVADKGLNCSENILEARRNGDGYIFSKSVKMLSNVEKEWVFLDNEDWKTVLNSNNEIAYKYKSCVDKFSYTYKDADGTSHKISLTEKRVVTFNPDLAKKQTLEIDKEVEKARKLCLANAKRKEFGDCTKFVDFKSTIKGKATDDKVLVSINEEAVEKAYRCAGYNLLVTSELSMEPEQIYSTYHNLWRIEESFRIMKSDLDARPVFLQKEDRIKGHFLICYIAVLLERLLQYKVLKNKYGSSQIMKFARDFQIVKVENKKYINVMALSDVINELSIDLAAPITNYYIEKKQITEMLNGKFKTNNA